jgi:hypothetical protein
MREKEEAPNKQRVIGGMYGSTPSDGMNGFFNFERTPLGKGKVELFVIASDGVNTGWEHVSVSVKNFKRLPTWEEMAYIKSIFWKPTEVVVEYHPKEEDYINNHDVLHLWRKVGQDFETPPTYLIGLKK